MFLTTRGLILREAKYKEADKILTILTDSEGKLSAKARSCVRAKSKLAAATQLYSFSELTLFGSRGRWSVNEAESIETFRGLRDDISLLALGGYIAELLEAVSDEDSHDGAALQLGLNSLYAISAGLYPREQVKAAFELRLMCLGGYQPELSVCGGCGLEPTEGAYLLPEHGELRCQSCGGGGMEIDKSCLDAMRHIISAGPKRVFAFSLPETELPKLGEICESYAITQLGRSFGSLDYYKKVCLS